jgi:hypothetical protein
MKKSCFRWLFLLFRVAAVVSCKKDKPLTSESNEVTTTKDGTSMFGYAKQ